MPDYAVLQNVSLTTHPCALQRSAMCFLPPSHSAPNGAGEIRTWSYKHVAPPEQEPWIRMMTTFEQSHFKFSLRARFQHLQAKA
jgi:hypothetical protein